MGRGGIPWGYWGLFSVRWLFRRRDVYVCAGQGVFVCWLVLLCSCCCVCSCASCLVPRVPRARAGGWLVRMSLLCFACVAVRACAGLDMGCRALRWAPATSGGGVRAAHVFGACSGRGVPVSWCLPGACWWVWWCPGWCGWGVPAWWGVIDTPPPPSPRISGEGVGTVAGGVSCLMGSMLPRASVG